MELKYEVIDADWGIRGGYNIGYEVADWLIHKALGYSII